MKLTIPPLNFSKEDGFLPEVDIFNRKVFGETLLNLIKNTDDELVLALDAPWGEGKSTFIKMWQGFLTKEQIPNLYFDAFENDYQRDPFLAITSQIYQLIDSTDDATRKEFKDKAVSALKIVSRASLRIGIKALTAGVLDETVLEDTGTSKEASDLVDGFVSDQLTKVAEDRKNLEDFKIHLSKLANELGRGKPVIFVIDELDRCKPKFALALIESIKHLFCVPNITFVLVMNRAQMEEAIRCEYGRKVDAVKYLQKFVSIWSTLPKSNKYISVPKKYLKDCLSRMGHEITSQTQHDSIEFFEELAIHYDLSLREIERSLTNFAIIHNATDGELSCDYSSLAVFVSVTKAINPEAYRKLSNNKITYNELLTKAKLAKLESCYTVEMPEKHHVKWLLKYYLSTEEEAKVILEKGSFLDRSARFNNRDAITTICECLESFKRE